MSSKTTSQPQKRATNIFQRLIRWFLGLSIWNKLALLFLVLCLPLGYGALLLAKPIYKSWRADNALKMAATAIEKGDQKSASLAFRTAIRSRPSDPAVWRQVAVFLDESGSPEALTVWDRVVSLRPDDVDARLALAEAAVRLGQTDRAEAVLAAVPEASRDTERFHRAAAGVAMARNNAALAERELGRVLELNPEAADAKWDLTRVRLLHPDLAVRRAAYQKVQDYAEGDSVYRLDAMRQLVRVALAEGDFYTANQVAARLVADPESTAQDQILHLDTEFASQSFTLPITRSEILDYAAANPEGAGPVVNYLLARGARAEVERWFESLPEAVANEPAIQTAWFDFALKNVEWDLAFELLRGGRMPYQLSPELVDGIQQALGEFRRGNRDAITQWQRALYLGESNPAAIHVMSMIARAADWRQAYAAAIRSLAVAVSGRTEIWTELLRMELEDRNTPGILSALAGAVRADPDNRQLRNDWILVNLLMEKGTPADLNRLAAENYESNPNNPFYATTYSLALARSGDVERAAEIVRKMPPEEQLKPDKALYVGAVLALADDREAAVASLDRAATISERMLPEERNLLASSRALARGETSRADQISVMTARSAMSDDELAEFTATVRAQSADSNDDVQADELLESLRRSAEETRRSPEEIQKILDDVRAPAAE